MPIRMSGLVSNLDTEGIIKELMKAQSLKKTTVEKKITKLEWKQEKWKELNTKIYALYTDTLSKMKTEGSYLAKMAKSSNENKLTVTATKDAAEGTHMITVDKLASSQYLTGGEIPEIGSGDDARAVNRATLLKDLGFATDGSTVIQIQVNGKDTMELAVDEYTTVADFVESCDEAGINANFDEKTKRFFISAKESGITGAFRLEAKKSSIYQEREAIKDALNYNNLSGTDKITANKLISEYKAAINSADGERVSDAEIALGDFLETTMENKVKKDTEENYRAGLVEKTDFDQATLDGLIETALSDAESEIQTKAIDLGNAMGTYASVISEETFSAVTDGGLTNLSLTDINYSLNESGEISYTFDAGTTGATKVDAGNGQISYNGTAFTGSSNSYSINGLNLTTNGLSSGENITVNVTKDIDKVYETVKSFVKQYNELLDEMNKLYGADSAKGYDVLTDEEREAMTEEQIKKWEDKIKDSLLRRDETLGGLVSTMRTTLSKSITVEGKNYALSSFGIVTSDYKEKGKLHILGDSEDTYGATYTDKLKSALSDDTDTVMQVLTGLASDLYDEMADKMKGSTLSSALTFYNDKQMDKTMTTYKDELSTLEERLLEVEDRYYKQFTAMEVAMSKLTSQQNSLASMLGTSVQQ